MESAGSTSAWRHFPPLKQVMGIKEVWGRQEKGWESQKVVFLGHLQHGLDLGPPHLTHSGHGEASIEGTTGMSSLIICLLFLCFFKAPVLISAE